MRAIVCILPGDFNQQKQLANSKWQTNHFWNETKAIHTLASRYDIRCIQFSARQIWKYKMQQQLKRNWRKESAEWKIIETKASKMKPNPRHSFVPHQICLFVLHSLFAKEKEAIQAFKKCFFFFILLQQLSNRSQNATAPAIGVI